jgi:hypothetical protein
MDRLGMITIQKCQSCAQAGWAVRFNISKLLSLFAVIFGAVLRPSERMGHPARGQSFPTAQVRGLVCAAAATQQTAWQDRLARLMVLASQVSMFAASLRKSFVDRFAVALLVE